MSDLSQVKDLLFERDYRGAEALLEAEWPTLRDTAEGLSLMGAAQRPLGDRSKLVELCSALSTARARPWKEPLVPASLALDEGRTLALVDAPRAPGLFEQSSALLTAIAPPAEPKPLGTLRGPHLARALFARGAIEYARWYATTWGSTDKWVERFSIMGLDAFEQVVGREHPFWDGAQLFGHLHGVFELVEPYARTRAFAARDALSVDATAALDAALSAMTGRDLALAENHARRSLEVEASARGVAPVSVPVGAPLYVLTVIVSAAGRYEEASVLSRLLDPFRVLLRDF